MVSPHVEIGASAFSCEQILDDLPEYIRNTAIDSVVANRELLVMPLANWEKKKAPVRRASPAAADYIAAPLARCHSKSFRSR